MDRKKISPYIFLALALFLIAIIVLIEHSLKAIYDQAEHPRGYLVLDLLSKACLSMITGSIFFLVTEWFKDRKAKDKAADIQREFLSEIRLGFNGFIQGFVNGTVVLSGEPERDYLGTCTRTELIGIVQNWREDETTTVIDAMEDAIDHIYSLKDYLFDRVSFVNYYRASFSVDFNRRLDETMRHFDRLPKPDARPQRSLNHRARVAVTALLWFRDHIVELENVYRADHKLGLIIPPSGDRPTFVFVKDWPGSVEP